MGDFLSNNDIIIRPNVGCGFWLMYLLPAAIITSSLKHPIVLTPTYKLASIFSIGLILISTIFLCQCTAKSKRLKVVNLWNLLAALVTSFVFLVAFEKGLGFSLFSGIFSTLIYHKIYLVILKKLPQCFTLGEASVASQALVILLYFTILNITNAGAKSFTNPGQISTVIIQIGLVGLGVIGWTAVKFNFNKPANFYLLTIFVLLFAIFLPLHILLKRSPVLWILEIIFTNITTLKLIFYWGFCTSVATFIVSKQITHARKASTAMRKVFHILAVAVYIPGFLYKCSFLYLASGVVLGIFFALEIVRILQVPPLGVHLQDGFVVFSDDKDSGVLALTPIYLLAGCSLPLWIHPAPWDVTDSAMFNLLPLMSGLLSIGIGDTCASIVGSNYGRFHWKGSKKTVEGTIACVLSQGLMVFALIFFGCLPNLNEMELWRVSFAIAFGSIVEAKTDQVDNLVLPLIMYIILV